MLPGPNYIYKCPSCGNFIKRGSLISGNTYGAKLYSDGKRVAPMMPEFPDLTKCKKCNAIFWLSKLEEIGTEELDDSHNSKWKDADDAEFLEINDYFKALGLGISENINKERFIRREIWWAYNDKVREGEGEKMFDNEDDEMRWKENLLNFIKLLDTSDINSMIMKAEIRRSLGEFDKCIKIMQSIDNQELDWLKEKFINECKQKNQLVIELN